MDGLRRLLISVGARPGWGDTSSLRSSFKVLIVIAFMSSVGDDADAEMVRATGGSNVGGLEAGIVNVDASLRW